MSTLRTIIVDDEQLARRGLAIRLQQMPQIDVIAECSNGQEALAAVAQHHPDLLFLDIQMPGMDGFDVVAGLQGDTMPLVIFVTAFDEYAVQAFRVHAVDYVLKPVEDDRLHEAIERALAHRQNVEAAQDKQRLMEMVMDMTGASASSVAEMASNDQQAPMARAPALPDKLSIRDGNATRFVKVTDIRWIDAAGDYMCVHANGDTHIMRTTMKQLEAMLDPNLFLRVHRSTIVNASRISSAHSQDNGDYLLSLDCGSQLKVSRGCRERVRRALSA